MKYHWIIAILLLNLVTCVVNESFYSIIAPGTLKPYHRYSIVVTLYDDATEPASIQVSIDGPSYNKSEQLRISPGETKQVNFIPPELESGKYLLRAEGLSGISFKNESILTFALGRFSKVYIQLDKGVYRPMEFIQFRVVMLDEHTRPLNISEPIRVEIMDGHSNRVKQFEDITLVKGVYTETIQLPEYPAFGHWQILIKSGKNNYLRHKTFLVEEYVRPKFSVTMENPANITPDDRVIKAIIYGKYTFDKYVKLNATITLRDARRGTKFEEKQLSIDRMGSVEFKIDDPEKYSNVEEFSLEGVLTEQHTGISKFTYSTIQVRSQQYNIQILADQIEYRGNKPYRMKVKVQYWNDVPVLDTKTPVYMEHGSQTYESHLDAEGIATFEFDHDSMSEHKIRYKDSIATLPNIFAEESSDSKESPLRLKLMGGSPRLGKMIEIEVSSDADIPHIIYMVTSHSTITQKEYIKLPAKQKSYIIQIKPSIEMIPRSYVYVHYIQNGNLLFKEMMLEFPFELENQISVTAPQKAAPGSEVTINLRAQPTSYVCIFAVDLSVYLTQKSHDLYKKKILDDLLGDISYTPITTPIGSTDYPGLLSGLITLTNAHFPVASLSASDFYSEDEGDPFPLSRLKYPEAWIFQDLHITKDNTELTLTIPDTITTWRITAFSMHEVTGLGIVDGPTDIVTILPFFIYLNLPYSVKRGEILSLPISVFNYHNQSLDAEITMYNNDQKFDFVDPKNPPSNRDTNDQKQQVKRVKVPSDSMESVSFMIKPKEVGDITLKVSGTTQLSSDAIVQKLKVEPEGAAKAGNKAMLLQISMRESNVATLRADIPEVIVPQSEYLSLSIGGDTLASTMENLNGLVSRPTGCGEQTMVNFAPNVLVMQYLKSVGKLETEKKLVTQAMHFIEIGYQQQLSFRHESGGYSVFGEFRDNRVASTWLTAYVIRFFIKAAKFTSIDENIIVTGLDYLANQQLETGELPFTGYLLYPAQQNRLGCTAFVLMTFLEEKKYSDKYKNVIENGLKFLQQRKMNRFKDVYALSIMAVTLQMAKHANAKKVLNKLQKQSKEQDGLKWWSGDDNNIEKDVEITSYVMLALLETQADYNGILKWLIGQRNAYGGFKSTQDTVVGLQALVKYSEKFNDPNTLKLNLTYIAKNELGDELKTDDFSLDVNNSLILQTHALPRSTRSITFNATGSGQSMLQLTYNYNVAMEEPEQYFLIDLKSNLITSNSMTLDVCFTYQPTTNTAMDPPDAGNKPEIYSNMVILEVNLPTGFRLAQEFNFILLENALVRRIESKNDDSIIVIYLDNLLADTRNCLRIEAYSNHDAMNLKPVPVVMYDYYNNTRTNTKFYTAVKLPNNESEGDQIILRYT